MNIMERVDTAVAALEPELIEMSHFIHDNPEIGMEEYKACAYQVELLKKHGFTVKTNIYGMETAYEAVYKGAKDGPKIATLAEYDALPEIGHGCGHNLIALIGIGAGIAMKEFADEYGGEIHVFGTPAEENIGGKVIMAREGAFRDIDVAMMSHPMNANMDGMNSMALSAYYFRFYGRTAHAAAAPHEGVNALDAMINFYNLINAMRQQTKDDARIHGIITHGGEASNVIPDFTEAIFCIRAHKNAYLKELEEKVFACGKAAALGTGCRFEYEPQGEAFMDTKVNRPLYDLNTEMMEKLGVSVVRTQGEYVSGSSDMGDVSYSCPGIQNVFDICEGENIGAHTIEFAQRAGENRAMGNALTYVKGHVLTAVELMRNPEKLAEIKDDFERK